MKGAHVWSFLRTADAPTGPELLDALDRLYAAVSLHEDIICELGDSPRCMTMVNDIILAWGETPPDAIARLRSLLRTPEETAVLRAAISWLGAFIGEDETVGLVGAEEDLVRALDALPPERRAAVMKEDKTHGM
jgi:hypothetical protein